MRPRDQSQIARKFVDDDLLIRGAGDPFVAGQVRLTHLYRADQRSQCFTVVTSGPDDMVLTWC